MRILHLLASPYWSGPAENVALLAQAQRELGHEVSIAIDRRRIDAPAEELSAPRLRDLRLLDDGGLELCVKAPVWRIWTDARRLRARAVDVVHSHFTHDHYVARLGRPTGATLVRSLHAPRSIRWSLPDADAYTVPCEGMFRPLMGHRIGLLPALVDPSFKPPESRATRRRELGLEDTLLVGMVSTFQPSRRHDIGVAAFAELRRSVPEASLLLVGDGVLQPQVRAQAEAAGLSAHVRFAGYQSGAAFVRWLQALDVVWILGLGNDWSARAAVQARACGVRVVAVDEGALSIWADAIVPLDAAEIARVTMTDERRDRGAPSNLETARDVLRLYGRG